MVRSQCYYGIIGKAVFLKILESIFQSLLKFELAGDICLDGFGILESLLRTPFLDPLTVAYGHGI